MARFDLIGEVRREYETETGEKFSRAAASVIVDRMCDAFLQHWEGDRDSAVRDRPETARWLAWRWTGNDGRELREKMTELGVEF